MPLNDMPALDAGPRITRMDQAVRAALTETPEIMFGDLCARVCIEGGPQDVEAAVLRLARERHAKINWQTGLITCLD